MKDFFDKVEELGKGIWIDEEEEMDIDISDEICYDKGKTIKLKTGYVCFECDRNVLAFSQPFTCEEHE
jgi:hypothetical protein